MTDKEKYPDRETQIRWGAGKSTLSRYHLTKEIKRELKDGRESDGRTEEPLNIEIDPTTIEKRLNITEKDLPHIVLTQHDLEMLFPDGVPDFGSELTDDEIEAYTPKKDS